MKRRLIRQVSTSLTAVLATAGTRRRTLASLRLRSAGSEPRCRVMDGVDTPVGVTTHDCPSTRSAAAAQPAVLSRAATGPCSGVVDPATTKTAPATLGG
jgi:hypothetical protein